MMLGERANAIFIDIVFSSSHQASFDKDDILRANGSLTVTAVLKQLK